MRLLALLVLVSAQSVFASEAREAWLSASSFDGQIFRYQLVAYDAGSDIKAQPKISCEYTQHQGQLILKAVEVKIMLDGEFNRAGNQVNKTGSVDVRKAIQDCQSALPGGKNPLQSPVALKLPQISVPAL